MPEITSLFAIEAEELLDGGSVQEAIDLCEQGIERFPNYPSAYAILARAYTIAGMDDQAQSVLKVASDFFPNNAIIRRALEHFHSEVKQLSHENVEESLPRSHARMDFLKKLDRIKRDKDEDFELKADNPSLIPGIEYKKNLFQPHYVPIRNYVQPLPDPPPFPVFGTEDKDAISGEEYYDENELSSLLTDRENSIEELARKIKSFDRHEFHELHEEDQEGREFHELHEEDQEGRESHKKGKVIPKDSLVTETVARIYKAQGFTSEAINAYKELAEKYPDKYEFYMGKIKELKRKLHIAR